MFTALAAMVVLKIAQTVMLLPRLMNMIVSTMALFCSFARIARINIIYDTA
jgi:hypothetical protein